MRACVNGAESERDIRERKNELVDYETREGGRERETRINKKIHITIGKGI